MKNELADTCPHCDHALRDHKAESSRFMPRMIFRCSVWQPDDNGVTQMMCVCSINGSVELLTEAK